MCLLQFARFSRRNPRSGNPMMASRLDSADQEKPPSYLLLVLVPVLVLFCCCCCCSSSSSSSSSSSQTPPQLPSRLLQTLNPGTESSSSLFRKLQNPISQTLQSKFSFLKKESQPRQSATKESLRVRAVALFSLHLLMLNSALSSFSLSLYLALSLAKAQARRRRRRRRGARPRNLTIARV